MCRLSIVILFTDYNLQYTLTDTLGFTHCQSADQKILRTVFSNFLNPMRFDVTMAVEIRIQAFK